MIYHSEVLLSVPDPAREASKYNFQNTAFQLWSWLCWIKDCSHRGDLAHLTLHRKWGIPWRISSVNVTKSAGNCRLVTFTEEFLNRRLHFFCSVTGLACLVKISLYEVFMILKCIHMMNKPAPLPGILLERNNISPWPDKTISCKRAIPTYRNQVSN